MVHSFHDWPTLSYPVFINALGLLTGLDIVAARLLFALAMPPALEVGKIWLVFKAEPPVSA